MALNKVMLIGNVGKDPDVRYLEGNNQGGASRKVASFTLATSERYKDRNGEIKENTEWHNIVAWGQPADVVEKYVKKGTQLYIEGRLRTRSWNDQSGNKRYTTEINVDSLQLLGKRESPSEGGFPAGAPNNFPTAASSSFPHQPQPQQPVFQKPIAAAMPEPEGSDDLPF